MTKFIDKDVMLVPEHSSHIYIIIYNIYIYIYTAGENIGCFEIVV